MEMTIYTANCVGVENNSHYRNCKKIRSPEELKSALAFDHVCAKYKNGHRSNDDFEEADCTVMDCDNDHSDNPDDWIYPEDMDGFFPDVKFAVAPSRNNMKQKDNKSPRPRFHIYFRITKTTDSSRYKNLKVLLHEMCPFLDDNAMDKARFIFGCEVDEVIWHDGEITVDRYMEVFGGDHKTIKEGSRNDTLSRFAAKVIKRYGYTDEAYRIYLQKSEQCDPPLDDSEIETIWKAKKVFARKITSAPDYIPADEWEKKINAENTGEVSPAAWEQPLPFDNADLPPFPMEALPKVLGDYALAVSRSTQTPVDMTAVSLLAVASACMRNLYKVEGKADWLEPTNLYSVIIAEPSERKSAVVSMAVKPVNAFVKEYNEKHKVEFEMSRATKQRLENKKNSLISQSRKKGEDKSADDFNDALRNAVEELVNFREVKPLRVYVDDTTPEKLTETLSDNNNAISIISSEGGIFDVLSGTYSNKVNIDVFLKAYSGESISVDRIMRQSVSVEEACLTILLSVQPVVISEIMGNKKFRHRGLTARFLYTMPESFVGKRELESEPVPPGVYAAYRDIVYNMLSEQREKYAKIIPLTPVAREKLSIFYDWVEKRLGGEYSMYSDWLGKLVGNTLRIAGILARVSVIKNDVSDAFLQTDPAIQITGEIMGNAIKIGRYFLMHAVNAYGNMGVNADFKAPLEVLNKIKDKGLRTVTRRDIMRFCRWVGSADEAQNLLNDLEDYGYVRLSSVDASDKLRNGRPKNAVYSVNPRIYD